MGIKLYDGLSSTVARSLATSDPSVNVRLDGAAPPAADTVFVADGAGAGTWGAPPAGELPEILQAIATADPPDAEGQTPTFDGVGITWAAPSGGGGGISLTGNPFIDNWGTLTSTDDEFDSGPDDMGSRGWEVWNLTDGIALTRAGKVSISSPCNTNEYRSTRRGTYMALQLPPGKLCVFLKPYVGSSSELQHLKFGRPWHNHMYDGGVYGPRADSPIISDSFLAMAQYGGAVGTLPPVTHYTKWYIATDANRPRWGWDSSHCTGSTNIATDAFACASLLNTDQLVTREYSNNGIKEMWCMDSVAGSTMGYYHSNVPYQSGLPTITRTGFAFNYIGTSPPHVFLVDYFRCRSGSWFGLTEP